MRYSERNVIRSAALGLFHGADCFEFYKRWCRNPQLVHDVHVSANGLPSTDEVRAKSARAIGSRRLQIMYAGRATAMKGPRYWVQALAALRQAGVPFHATWFGDGQELPSMTMNVAEAGLQPSVSLAGQTDHRVILQRLREADLLMFCHLTPESPRILIESLNQGTPIVGFRTAYAADLVKEGGGILTAMGQTDELAQAVVDLHRNRLRLASLVMAAAKAGRELTDEAVFGHRAALIKRYLP